MTLMAAISDNTTILVTAARLRPSLERASRVRLRPAGKAAARPSRVAARSVIAHPGIECCVEQVDDQVEDNDEDGNQHHRSHHQRIVAIDRAENEVTADTRDREDRLDDDGPGE